MKTKYIISIFVLLLSAFAAFGQTSWLDRPLRTWNNSANVPVPPRTARINPANPACRDSVRRPETIADRAVTRAGWSLFGAAQIYGAVTLLNGTADFDGMCRPMLYNTFIFVGARFAGTLSPEAMNSRTDGALTEATLIDAKSISAEFARYTSTDGLCCPSQTSAVTYEITGVRVEAKDVNTFLGCAPQSIEHAVSNIVRGTVSMSGSASLPRNSILNVRIVDAANRNIAPRLITEQRIDLAGRQLPVEFELRIDPRDMDLRNNYSLEADVSSAGRVLYRSDPGIMLPGAGSLGSIIVYPVGAGQTRNEGTLNLTVTYRERVNLPRDAEVRAKLVEVSTAGVADRVIAEEIHRPDGRQVPLRFDLKYDRNLINPRRRYVVQAEIFIEGKRSFGSDAEYAVLTEGNPGSSIVIMLAALREEEPAIVTGKSVSISKFGTGSLEIEGQGSEFLIRASVNVKTDGSAEVSLNPIGTSKKFSGDLVFADNDTLRIRVRNYEGSDATGEIEVRYSGQRLNSVSSKDLVVDGQKARVSF